MMHTFFRTRLAHALVMHLLKQIQSFSSAKHKTKPPTHPIVCAVLNLTHMHTQPPNNIALMCCSYVLHQLTAVAYTENIHKSLWLLQRTLFLVYWQKHHTCSLTCSQPLQWVLPEKQGNQILGIWRRGLILFRPVDFIWKEEKVICSFLAQRAV